MINLRSIVLLMSTASTMLSGDAVALAQTQQIRAVLVRAHEINVREADGTVRQLTRDGLPKALPTWSKDGFRIAYIERNAGQATGFQLKVIGPAGQPLYQAPLQSNDMASSMRFADSLEWIAVDKIVVGGSINPTTRDYKIFDLHASVPVTEFFDDGVGAAFSPDGAHFASIGGRPHFTPDEERAPTLEIDDQVVFDKLDSSARIDALAWSPNGSALAFSASNPKVSSSVVYVWRQGKIQSYPIASTPTDADLELFWSGNDLIIDVRSAATGLTTQALRAGSTDIVLQSVPLKVAGGTKRPNVPNPADEANALVFPLRHDIEQAGGRQPSFWCSACVLNMLPYRSSSEL